jgi:hypothetical protein
VKELTQIPNPPKTGKASQKPPPKGGRKTSAAKGTKTSGGRGTARLRNRAGKKSNAVAIVGKTKAGNKTGPRLVVELSGAEKNPSETKKKKKRGIQPWVERLCSEPEWEGPWEDEDAHHDAPKLAPREPNPPTK